jgi:MSHA biogenesis protein MshM
VKPIDRFGLDLHRIRYLSPSEVSDELFFVEQERSVLTDNTFSLKNTRFEAPRDLRNRKVQVRFDRLHFERAIVYYKGERMSEARPVDFVGNDRKHLEEERGAVVIRPHFGLENDLFSSANITLLPQQRDILDTLRVHCQQGGLCVVVGEPGTGKTVIKQALCQYDPKRLITPVVSRTLHTYHSTLRILGEAFQIEAEGVDVRCERRLIEEARRLNAAGKMLAPVIDDAHLMDMAALRKIRLLFEDFPKNHCLVLIAQPELLSRLSLTVNEDIKSQVTYSVLLQKLAPDTLVDFIKSELDKVALAHSTFTDDALSLIVRSAEGGLRRAKNLCRAARCRPRPPQNRRSQTRQPRPAPAPLAPLRSRISRGRRHHGGGAERLERRGHRHRRRLLTLDSQILRRRPQLATVEVLTSVLETTLVALCAAHPLIELDLKTRTDPVLPIDHLADRVAEQAIQLLDALDRYRLAQYDLEHARHARSQAPEEDVF